MGIMELSNRVTCSYDEIPEAILREVSLVIKAAKENKGRYECSSGDNELGGIWKSKDFQ